MIPKTVRSAFLIAFVTMSATGQSPRVGEPAPAVTAAAWLNWDGAPPSLEALAGKVVLLEFWGTWCGPCVRAMPGIQKLHDRYRDRGLCVLAISYEPADTLRPFLTERAFTMPVGSDPEKKTVAAYGIRSWPTTIVVDKEGKVAHVGSPYDAEAAVEKALGLEAGPASLLDAYLDSLDGKPADQRSALARLTEKAAPGFDLRAWALGHVAPATVSGEGDPANADAAPARPAGREIDADAALLRCVRSWRDAGKRDAALRSLADAGPTDFDLATFAVELFAKEFPLDASEVRSMLDERKYAEVVDAIANRAPAAKVVALAAKDKGLSAWCKGQLGEARTMARKGIMAKGWLFPGALPRDEKLNEKFFGELAVSGMATSQDRKSITGVLLGGEMVMHDRIDGWVASRLGNALVMASFAKGKAPDVRGLAKEREQEQTAITRDLESRYGKPEPRQK